MKNIIVIAALMIGTLAYAQEIKPKFEKMDDGLLKATYFHDNGEIAQEGTFLDKQRHGEWISYDQDGKKTAQAQYTLNQKTGKWFFWHNDLLTEVDYNGDQIVSVNKWVDQDAVASNRP
ncbi:toxin-antitoxin system YwqK family antitoxin [Nonlabens ponticola]|uniref:Nicotinic acid mononucleotide adenyltransferase n=1 Tax=Nonlabens ponticola TaxID=2496866 RepID=A0A3S9MUX4_9FLAO|nr:nicotinic acid mononucleotide adenyltransferase [Nonlabens ponticola]AZQ42953.1 nicotinic acid mononucleotide adenyltransferase [Nonlabens ponticola]